MENNLIKLPGDTATHRITVEELPEDSHEKWLEIVRTRRMEAANQWKEAVARAKAIKEERLAERLAQQLRLLEKDMTALDKKIEAVEKRITNVRVIRLQAGEL